tara:strand:+ start:421 stop:771 length:351 start_codon:yes stop_codon:yes gene_type:complete
MAAKTGSLIFLYSKLSALLILLRSLEQYTYLKSYGTLKLQEKDATENEINAYKIVIDNDIEFFKRQSIKNINKHIPEYLKVLEHFETWDEAMLFLTKFKQEIPPEFLHDKENKRNH